MLIQFNFKNYKSFREETVLDLSATKMTEFSDRVVNISSEKVLPIALIYGANASGKSNIYDAFRCMGNYVLKSFNFGDDEDVFKKSKPVPFLFDEQTARSETTFEIYFTMPSDNKEKTYNYGFSVGVNGVTEEWFNYKAKTGTVYRPIFNRFEEKLELQGIPEDSRKNIEVALEKQVLIASLGAKLKIEICKIIREWFLLNHVADFGDHIKSFIMESSMPRGFFSDVKIQEDVVNYLSSFDNSIKGFRIEDLPQQDDEEKKEYKVSTIHKSVDSDTEVEIPLTSESSGTLKMLSLYQKLQDTIIKGGVLMIDELNARLHPLLVRNFILTFLNPEINKNHAQLIFTSHETWLLSKELLRRDEIWFVEKSNDGDSMLYSLADFIDSDGDKIRKDENYEKNYLLGKYGAIPTLKGINIPKEV